jgi:hypothetical protein
MHGALVAAKAAGVQGSYSFFITLAMTLMLETIFKFLRKLTGRPIISAMATVVFSCAPVFIGSWMINVAAGTPEVFKTVILGYVLGGAYCSSYVIGLLKKTNA